MTEPEALKTIPEFRTVTNPLKPRPRTSGATTC